MKKHLGLISIIFVMLVWGSSVAVTKVLVADIPPLFFAFLRFLIASVCLLPVFIFSKQTSTKQLKRSDYAYLTLMGLLGVTFFYIAFNLSLKYTSASTGALIQGSLPVIIAVLGLIFLKEKLSKLQIAGILLSTAGVAAVGFFTGDDQSGDTLKGNLLMIAAMVCWGLYTIISRKLSHINSLTVTCLSGFTGTILLLPAALIDLHNQGNTISLSLNDWLALIYLGAMASALCYFLYNKALETLPAAQVGNFLNLDPIVGVIIAFIFLDDHITTMHIIGSVCVLAGITMSSIKKH
jgi:drug/metabolite transporter (DMT)-like permease